MATPESSQAGLAQRLSDAADDIAAARTEGQPAPLAMSRGRRGFAIGGIISALLDEEAAPHRDTFAAADALCTRARQILDDLLGPALIRKYAAGTRPADIDVIAQRGRAELFQASPEDVDTIAEAMITLAARLEELFAAVARDESRPPELRRAAGSVGTIARELWATYGGDGGGW